MEPMRGQDYHYSKIVDELNRKIGLGEYSVGMYLPYEKHHMLYIEMMDTLIDTMEKDQEYKCFHLDGQTIMLED